MCRPVFLQTTTARGAGVEERRDGGSIRPVQRGLAARVITEDRKSGHLTQQLHHTCAQVRCSLALHFLTAENGRLSDNISNHHANISNDVGTGVLEFTCLLA